MKNILGKLIVLGVLILGFWWMWGVSKLSGNFRYTVFRSGSEYLEIITAEPNQNYVTILKFPNQFWIKTVWGRGEWKIDNLEALAEKYGDEWLSDSIGEVLANGTAINYRNLKIGDRVNLYRKINNDNSQIIEVEKLDLWEEKIAPDGEKIKYLSIKWDSYKSKIFMDSKIAALETYVEVENASGMTGLGTRAANSIDITGTHVFDVSKSEEVIDKCQVLVKNMEKNNPLIEWLMSRFDCFIGNTREDRVIILKIGKDWGEKVKDFL